ncbi:MAG TPA: ATPase, T2SS/T4P/T4SS family [Candidatus Limnocylindria bacterium]|nr:ATPase, T2SS/T4P/T4SS family [Candidatus Limnocylindria bacterium]
MIDAALVARVRAAVAQRVEPAALLATYAEPDGRALLRERVRAAAGAAVGDAAIETLCAELFGFGPVQRFLDDPRVTDVLVNAPDEIYVERDGVLQLTDARFADASELADLVFRVAASVGRELTVEHPFVDARMRDGSRANAVIAPVGGPTLSIRTFRTASVPLEGAASSWASASAIPLGALALVARAVERRRNVLVSGSTGSGKSTLVRALAAYVPPDERLIVIEDTSELVLPHPHVVRLECVPGHEGAGVALADLVVNALRMRPDRILVGEVRSPREASALLEAISTGHDGALTTLHAASAEDALARLDLLLARAGELSEGAIHALVRRSFDVIVHVARGADGVRRIVEVAEIVDGALRRVWARTSP